MSRGPGHGAASLKRFWDTADIEADEAGWRVLLDGRPVRVPGAGPLLLPVRRLAEAIAAEWQGAAEPGGELTYDDLPLTRLAGTALVRILPDPEPVILEIARYGESDLLCYRVDQPPALAERQHAAWQPWLDWAEATIGARLRVTTSLLHVPQEPAALAALAARVASCTHLELAALGVGVPALGSLVLGLAMAAAEITAPDAHALATLEERYQAEIWSWDAEAAARFRRVGEDLAVVGRFLALTRRTAEDTS